MDNVNDARIYRMLDDSVFLLAKREPSGWGDNLQIQLRIMESGWAFCFMTPSGMREGQFGWERKFGPTQMDAIREEVAKLRGVPVVTPLGIDAASRNIIFREGEGERILSVMDFCWRERRRRGDFKEPSPEFAALWDLIHAPFMRFIWNEIREAEDRDELEAASRKASIKDAGGS